jgi:HPt (histidine-containing phosphotransfer) domain-containing protein
VALHPENQAPVFDVGRLPAWLEASDRDGLLRLFIQTTHETLAKLMPLASSTPNSTEALRHEIHALKGAAVSVGAMRIAERCKAWEIALPKQDPMAFQRSLSELRADFEATQLAMQPHLLLS